MMKARDFFRALKEKGIRKSETEISSLKQFLAIDKNYPNQLMVSKLDRAIEECRNSKYLQDYGKKKRRGMDLSFDRRRMPEEEQD